MSDNLDATLDAMTARVLTELRPKQSQTKSDVPMLTTFTVDTGWIFELEPKAARLALAVLAYVGELIPPQPPAT